MSGTWRDWPSGDPLCALTPAASAGVRALDVGCGGGDLVRRWRAAGARGFGVDPTAPLALAGVGCAAEAERLPFAGETFDAIVFSLSLHHARDPSRALEEAHRLARPGGVLWSLEPCPEGPLHETVAPIVDETSVLASAQAALDAAPGWRELEGERFVTLFRYSSAAALIDELRAVDPSRAEAIERGERALEQAFSRRGPDLAQPMRLRRFEKIERPQASGSKSISR